jgi:hypothetical protein
MTASPATTIVPSKINRFGTPCSAMDVPVTAVPLGPIARDFSQSVPPDMRYRRGSPLSAGPPRRDSWQTRFGMARVDEDVQQEAIVDGALHPVPRVPVVPEEQNVPTATPATPATAILYGRSAQQKLPTTTTTTTTTTTNTPSTAITTPNEPHAKTVAQSLAPPVVREANHSGWMKKRKTKFLRHEWQEHFFTLRGTSLAMKPNDRSSHVLEHIDVDDYAIACSSIASNSKLSAAFKAMKLSGISTGSSHGHGGKDHNGASAGAGAAGGNGGGSGDSDGAPAFAFQLVPAADKKDRYHHAATGRTHHFAVKSRDERIEWMRELMLAKALKQKREGYQISVNGNRI